MTILPRQRDHVFRSQSCYSHITIFFVAIPSRHGDLNMFSIFFWSPRLYYVVALSLSQSWQIVACPPLRGLETWHTGTPLWNLLQPWQAWLLGAHSNYFWDSVHCTMRRARGNKYILLATADSLQYCNILPDICFFVQSSSRFDLQESKLSKKNKNKNKNCRGISIHISILEKYGCVHVF